MDYEEPLLDATEEAAASLAPTGLIGIGGWQGRAIDRLNNALGDASGGPGQCEYSTQQRGQAREDLL